MALQLRRQGYDAYALEGGLQAWADAGYDLEPKEQEAGRTVQDVCPECAASMDSHTLRRGAPTAP